MNDVIATPPPAPKSKIRISRWIIPLLLIGGVGALGSYVVKLNYHLLNQAAKMQADLNALHTGLAQQQLVLQKFAPKSRTETTDNAPLLAEVTYLVKTANLVLLLENDVTSALNFLTTAKQRLATKPEFLALSLAIDQDISALQTDAATDVEKIVLRLEILLQQLATTDTNVFSTPAKTGTLPNITSLPWWQKVLHRAWQELQQALIIRHHTTANAQSLTLEQLAEAKLNIQFRLLQAEWALMHRDPVLYKSSLKSADDWLHKFFPHSETIKQFSKELEELQLIRVPTKPNIQTSMKALLNEEKNSKFL